MPKINIEVSKRQVDILNDHKDKTKSSISNTVRSALNLYFRLYRASQSGAQFFIKRGEENTQELIISDF